MITADEARKGTKTENNKEYHEFMAEIEKRIKYAMEDGHRSCCFGMRDCDLSDAKLQVKEEFERRGFTFRPTGVIGGVYQHTQEICW